MVENNRLRIVFFGSGAFGAPTLRRLMQQHDIAMVVSQPDRPAGRNRVLTPTPIAELAQDAGLKVFKPEDPNEDDSIERIRAAEAPVFIVIAYGHKLSEPLIEVADLAINLHGSLLPKYRGAAPVQRAMMAGEHETGVSVIKLAQRMDAGLILAQRSITIDPLETAGELHDRLAELGPEAIESVLCEYVSGALAGKPQDESQRSSAPKLSKSDGTVDFNQPPHMVRSRIHGLTPWPSCTVLIDGKPLKILRVKEEQGETSAPPGTVLEGGRIACAPGTGTVRLLEVQPPGGRPMSFEEYTRGHSLTVGEKCVSP